MHKKNLAGMLMGCLLGLSGVGTAVALDYQSMSLDELNALRRTSALADSTERDAFQQARQEKIRSLSPDARHASQTGKRYAGTSGTGMRLQDGSCSGSMRQARQGGGRRGNR